jgi:YVTN family beta-propeller protein
MMALLVPLVVASAADAQPFAYVVGQRTPSGTPAVVSVIDTSSNTITASITVGPDCHCINSNGIAIVPDAGRVYVSHQLTGAVSAIDITSNTVVAPIPVGSGPSAIVASPTGTRVYVLNGSGVTSVSTIDTATDAVVSTTPVGPPFAAGMAISADGARLYVSTMAPNTVHVIDIASMTVTTTIPLGQYPWGLDVTPDASRIYVAAPSLNAVYAIDSSTNTVIATIPVGEEPRSVRITRDGSRVYVANTTSSSVSVIDTTTNAVVATVPGLSSPEALDFTPDGTRAYVASSASVEVIETTTNTVIGSIPFADATQGSPASIVMGRAATGNTPIAVNESYATNPNMALSVQAPGVLANDNTDGGGAMTTELVDDVTNGTLVLNSDGSFTYTPDANFSGTDSFTYRALNTVGASNVATVMLTVAIGAPVAVNDAYTTNTNTPLSVPAPGVLANDSTDGGGTTTTQLVNAVTNGTLVLNPNGSFTYTPALDFSGTDSFTYRTVNTIGQSNVATVTLTVAGGVQPPTALYAANIVGNTVTLRWTPPAGGATPTGYVVEGGVNPGEVLETRETGSTAPIITLVAPTGVFRVRVHALAGAEKSAASNEIQIFVNVPAAPSAPANLLGMVNGSMVSLAWRNTFEGGSPTTLLLDVVSGSSAGTLRLPLAETYTVGDVPAGTYTVSLRAENASGISVSSNPVTLTFPGPCSGAPVTPTGFVASKDGDEITVVWERATSGPAATAFVLNVTGAFVESFDTTERSLSGVVGPGSYTFTVQGINVCGASPPSAAQTVVIP